MSDKNISDRKEESLEKCSVQNLNEKIESTTQTDRELKKLEIENVQGVNIYNFKDVSNSMESVSAKGDDIETIEKKIHNFEENMETKISSGLNNIQSQMEAFWEKISELELKREQMLISQQNTQNAVVSVIESKTEDVPIKTSSPSVKSSKPEIKPRTKLGKSNKTSVDSKETVYKIKNDLEQLSKTEMKTIRGE
ncbi:hypothetical protein NQ317_017675 [Molorchus minor]|uniref:Uncharacterized protein n=1 Tax=Molorchus minor TaxID=1323400 RepID=A0ABQ9JNM5_9CUCU|nr:hypothetical protein NQ317_017675 [Molorchus minor]